MQQYDFQGFTEKMYRQVTKKLKKDGDPFFFLEWQELDPIVQKQIGIAFYRILKSNAALIAGNIFHQ